MRYLRAAVALVIAGSALSAAPSARAEASDTSDDTAGAEPSPKGPKLVVIADVAATATANSELRAALYIVARDLGYEAMGQLDVEGVASRASLMKAGTVTTDEAELEALRRAFEVSALVRVSKDTSGTTRMTVVMKRGAQSRVLGASDSPDALGAALKDLLPPFYSGDGAQPGGAAAPARRPDDASAGRLLLDPHTMKPTLPPREAWEKRGGLRPTYGAMLLASGTQIQHVKFTTIDGGRSVTGSADEVGVGGGVGIRFGLMYLPVPDPNLSTGGFVAFRVGAGLDTNVLYGRAPTGYDASHNVDYRSQALWVSSLPIHLGFAIATGKFSSPTIWRGVLIGLTYAPAAQFSMDLQGTSGTFRFNPAGVEASVDVTKLDASETDAGEPNIRFAVSALMPLDDDRPGFLSLGIGAIWY
jgi:hypothetical protein